LVQVQRLDAEASGVSFCKALAPAESRGMRPLVADYHRVLGRLYQCTGRQKQAREHFVTAMSMYREMGLHWGMSRRRQQARLVRLLVERVDVRDDGIRGGLRTEGLRDVIDELRTTPLLERAA
jgi:hypothetical protein